MDLIIKSVFIRFQGDFTLSHFIPSAAEMARFQQDPQNLWLYNPSLAAALFITHVYFLTTAVHVFQAFHYRARFCIPLLIGGVWETIGYALRAAGSQNEDSLGLSATQLTLIVLAPACKCPNLSGGLILG